MSITYRFLVEIDLDSRVGEAAVRDYISDAVQGWSGEFHPENPLFGTTRENVRVKRYTKPRKITRRQPLPDIT